MSEPFLVQTWDFEQWHNTALLAWQTYDDLATANEDPRNPSLPIRHWNGYRFESTPFIRLWESVVETYYPHAVNEGFTGNLRDWEKAVKKEGLYEQCEQLGRSNGSQFKPRPFDA